MNYQNNLQITLKQYIQSQTYNKKVQNLHRWTKIKQLKGIQHQQYSNTLSEINFHNQIKSKIEQIKLYVRKNIQDDYKFIKFNKMIDSLEYYCCQKFQEKQLNQKRLQLIIKHLPTKKNKNYTTKKSQNYQELSESQINQEKFFQNMVNMFTKSSDQSSQNSKQALNESQVIMKSKSKPFINLIKQTQSTLEKQLKTPILSQESFFKIQANNKEKKKNLDKEKYKQQQSQMKESQNIKQTFSKKNNLNFQRKININSQIKIENPQITQNNGLEKKNVQKTKIPANKIQYAKNIIDRQDSKKNLIGIMNLQYNELKNNKINSSESFINNQFKKSTKGNEKNSSHIKSKNIYQQSCSDSQIGQDIFFTKLVQIFSTDIKEQPNQSKIVNKFSQISKENKNGMHKKPKNIYQQSCSDSQIGQDIFFTKLVQIFSTDIKEQPNQSKIVNKFSQINKESKDSILSNMKYNINRQNQVKFIPTQSIIIK